MCAGALEVGVGLRGALICLGGLWEGKRVEDALLEEEGHVEYAVWVFGIAGGCCTEAAHLVMAALHVTF
jgi:hypothetical protein